MAVRGTVRDARKAIGPVAQIPEIFHHGKQPHIFLRGVAAARRAV